MTTLERVLIDSNNTIKELLITMAIENKTIEDILKDNNVKLGLFERLELKEQLVEAIKEL